MPVPSALRHSSVLLLLLALPLAAQQPPTHPLDALTSAEIRTVAAVIRAAGRTDSLTAFASVQLREPPLALSLVGHGWGSLLTPTVYIW